MIELYETFYSICNHVSNKHPFSSVLKHESEEYLENGKYETYIKKFLFKDVYKQTGLNLNQFLNMTRYEIETILKCIHEKDSQKDNVAKSLIDDLEDKFDKG